MTLRVVLYAEGGGETGGSETRLPTPLEPLAEEHLGPAHVLVRRAIRDARAIQTSDVTFLSPLLVRSRSARGSDLHDRSELRRLLAFVRVVPHLAIVLVDADGAPSDRRKAIEEVVRSARTPSVLGVAVQEFESWLISDMPAAAALLGRKIGEPPQPEGMARGEAKVLWSDWCAEVDAEDRKSTRLAMAQRLDLNVLQRRSQSFARFLGDLKTTLF